MDFRSPYTLTRKLATISRGVHREQRQHLQRVSDDLTKTSQLAVSQQRRRSTDRKSTAPSARLPRPDKQMIIDFRFIFNNQLAFHL